MLGAKPCGTRRPAGSVLAVGTGEQPFWATVSRLFFQMVDREKILAVLRKRFPSAQAADVAAAANAIVGLGDEWHEVAGTTGLQDLLARLREGREFRLFERRTEP